MKRRVYKKRIDGIRQRYWVGSKKKTKSKRRKQSIWIDVKEDRENSGYFDEGTYEKGRRKNKEGYEFNPRTARIMRKYGAFPYDPLSREQLSQAGRESDRFLKELKEQEGSYTYADFAEGKLLSDKLLRDTEKEKKKKFFSSRSDGDMEEREREIINLEDQQKSLGFELSDLYGYRNTKQYRQEYKNKDKRFEELDGEIRQKKKKFNEDFGDIFF